jgi:rod shape-determining protein MreB
MKFPLSNPFTEDLAIDLGTVHTFVYAPGRGMVVNEPSLVAVDRFSGDVIAVGNEALEMLGRSPEDVEVVYPMREGVVADSDLAQKLLARFMRKARGGRARFSRRVIMAVPSNISSVERFAVRDVVKGIGVARVYLVDEGMAAAIGVKLQVTGGQASMVVDIGGGTTSIAVIANSGIIHAENVRIGGLDMDLAITEYVKQQYRILIGERTAERLKMEIGSATTPPEERKSVVKGQSLVEARPATTEVTNFDIHRAINGVAKQMVDSVKAVLEVIPPEAAGDIHDRGIILTGGISLLAGMDSRIRSASGITVSVAESPRQSVGRGAIALFDQPLLLRRIARNVSLS